jgi:hypothetical protein
MHVLITAFFYAILASSWSMLAGYAGQFSFGHMAFMGIGAYGTALFCHYFYITAEPTGLCREFPFFGNWLVMVNPIGVTSTTLDAGLPAPGDGRLGRQRVGHADAGAARHRAGHARGRARRAFSSASWCCGCARPIWRSSRWAFPRSSRP